jgi:hypothetical protein
MTWQDIVWHLLNLTAPALTLAVLLPLLGGLLLRPRRMPLLPWWGQILANAGLGTLVLALALWGLGRDGKMLSYAALVLVLALAQWCWLRGWRR